MNLPSTARPAVTPKTKEKRTVYYYYLLPVLCLLLVTLLVVIVGIPEIQKIQTNIQDKQTKAELKEKLDKKIKQLDEIDMNDFNIKNDKLSYILPSEKDPGWIFAGISQVAADNGVTVTSIQTSPGPLSRNSIGEEKPTLDFVRVLVNVKGSLDGIKSMINTLANTGRLYKTKELTIQPPTEDDASYKGDLELKAYFQQFPAGSLVREGELVQGLTEQQKNIFNQIEGFEIKGRIFPSDMPISQTVTETKIVPSPTPEEPVTPPAPQEPVATPSASPSAEPG